jgi:predicted AAA+ superfamily ATPase
MRIGGRKAELRLTPSMSCDLESLHVKKLEHRLYRGGLPPFLLAEHSTESDFQEWMDSYWAKDIQELFRLDRRRSFLTFVELLLTSSGGIFEATRFARPSEVSRTTIANYLSVLETTLVAHVIRPYSTGKTAEIVAAPKVYAFDTGRAATTWACCGNTMCTTNCMHAYRRGASTIGATNKGTKWILCSRGGARHRSRLNASGALVISMRSLSKSLPPAILKRNISS